MPQIGEFTRTNSGFAGYVRTLTLDLEVSLDKAEVTDAENGPDYRLFHGDGDLAREIGAAWSRTGEKAGEYFSVLIDDPMPPLFVLGSDGELEIVNSRIHGNVLIVDRLFGAAELRLGRGPRQEVVRILRIEPQTEATEVRQDAERGT